MLKLLLLKAASCFIWTYALYASTDLNATYWIKAEAHNKYERTALVSLGLEIEAVREEFVYGIASAADLIELKKTKKVLVYLPLNPKPAGFPAEDSAFHDYSELMQDIEQLKNISPNIVRVETIGKSVEGRAIPVIKISKNWAQEMDLPAVIFVGGHHAREHLSVEIPLMLAQYLVAHQNEEKISNLLSARVVYIVPLVNPDGKEFDIQNDSYKMWRKNRRLNSDQSFGVDLNRNYAFGFGGEGSSSRGSADTYRGPEAFSEPETQSLKKFIEAHPNITELLSYHTYSALILYPWGHTYDPIASSADRRVYEIMTAQMAAMTGYTAQKASDLYLASGDTTDWAYGEHGIFSWTFELDPATWYQGGFYPGASYIAPVFDKNLGPALYLIDQAANPWAVLNERY